MKIPLDWLKEYVDISGLTNQQIADAFTSIGLMLDKPIAGGVLDLEHRFDRSDWLSIIGCARDFAAYQNLPLKLPKSYMEKGKPATAETLVKIKVECPNLVRRFNTRVFKNITVKPSPTWLTNRLEAYGMPSINNIVDITNYVMIEYGQTLHAQDLAKFDSKDKTLTIRLAKKDEKIVTLDGTAIALDEKTFILANGGKPVVIGGIVGGVGTGVTNNTCDILLDSGNYDQTNIRQTSRRLKIQNESASRNDKFLNPQSTQVAIERATQLILDLAGGQYYENEDYYPNAVTPKQIKLTLDRLTMVGGMEFTLADVKKILVAIDYKIINASKNEMLLEIPYFRTDVEVEDDVVSDILRINGYNKIPAALISSAPPKEITLKILDFEEKLRDVLVSLGLHEHITSPLIYSKQNPSTTQIILENSLNEDNDALREDIYSTLLPVIENYKKFGVTEIGIFEIGKTYTRIGDKKVYESYNETRTLEVILADDNLDVVELNKKVKEVFAGLVKSLGIVDVRYESSGKTGQGREAQIFSNKLAIGQIKYDSFTVYTEILAQIATSKSRVVTDLKYLSKEDLSLVVPTDLAFGPVYDFIKNYSKELLDIEVVETYLDEKLGKYKKAILVRLTVGKNDFMKGLVSALEKTFNIFLRK